MSDTRGWFAIREYGSKHGMQFLLACYRVGGRGVFAVCLFPVIGFYFCLRRDARRSSLQYLQLMHEANPDFPKPSLRYSFYHFWCFGLALLDKFSVWMGQIQRKDVSVHGGELIDAMLSSGRGGILLTSHLGNFEICHALSNDRAGMKLTILHHSQHTAKFNNLLRRYSKESRVELMDVSNIDTAAAIYLSAKISNGEFVAIATDRVPINNPSAVRELDFLGKSALFPTGPFVLALALHAPIFSLHCLKQDGRYHIYFEQLSDAHATSRKQRQALMSSLMNKQAARLEYYCRLAPWQWFNFYPFWPSKTPNTECKK